MQTELFKACPIICHNCGMPLEEYTEVCWMCSSNQSEMKRNNIELIQKEGYQEIVKWYDNPFYGKEADYPYEMGIFRHNDQHDFLLKDSFNSPRAMYVLASIKDNRIGFVNDRAAELEVADLYDFVKLLIEATESQDK